MIPRTRYASSEGGAVAYQVLGEGPDLICIPNWLSNLEIQWDEPSYARFLGALASFSRVICFDKRGSGLSEAISLSRMPTLESWMDDILAVMDAAGSERAALLAWDIGGQLAMLFAATYPERVSHLILADSFAFLKRDATHPIGVPAAGIQKFQQTLEDGFGDPEAPGWVSFVAPKAATDRRFRQWFSRMERLAGTPTAAAAIARTSFEWDLRPTLGSIRTPTLVLHHQSRRNIRPEQGRFLADNIAGARYVDLPGEDALIWREDTDVTLSEVRAFVTGVREAPETERVLATVLFTDIVASTDRAAQLGDRRWTQLLDAHDDLADARIAEFRGRKVKSTGDGVLATFDGPARAVRCAAAIAREAPQALGVEVRAGLHIGEIEIRGEDIGGIAVHTAARVMAKAAPGEVVISRTIRDLVAGSGLEFGPRGTHPLKGIPGEWELYALEG